MIFVDDKQRKHDESTKRHATNIKITSTTRHQKRFSTSNTKVKARTTCDQGSMTLTWMKTLGLGVAMCRELLFASRDDAPLTNNKGYIFIVRRLGKQSKLMCPYQTLSLTQSELNLMIHGPHGPNAHAGADS